MNYTKGEWKVDKDCGNSELYHIFSMVDKSCYLVADVLPRRETQANAHLITAAPDMYEALREILDITHNHGEGISKYVGYQKFGNLIVYTPEQINRIGDLCRNLTAKAEGR